MSEDREACSDAPGDGLAPPPAPAGPGLLVGCRDAERAHALLRGVQAVCGRGVGMPGDATSLSNVAPRIVQAMPDVLLLEYDPGDAAARRLLERLMPLSRGGRVLLLCDHCTEQSISGFVRMGIAGCVTSDDPMLLAKAICGVHAGQCWFPRALLVNALRQRLKSEPPDVPRIGGVQASLTSREREIITLVGSGYSNKEIGRLLQISHTTVQTQLHRVYVKLQASGRYKAYAAFTAQGAAGAPAAN